MRDFTLYDGSVVYLNLKDVTAVGPLRRGLHIVPDGSRIYLRSGESFGVIGVPESVVERLVPRR